MRDRGISVRLGQPGPIPLGVEFTCAPGDVVAIFGPSGSGKTTILRSIAGLYRPATALVRSGDSTWTDTAAGIFTPPHERAVGFVFQEYALFPHLSAIGNVMVALGHRPRPERRRRAESLLTLVHLAERMWRRPHQLSGGERQRVAVARALAREPEVLLLDEPFAAVDRPVRRMLQDEIDTLRRALEMPLILVTHDLDDVVRLATHVLMVEHGRGSASGPITELMSRPDLALLRAAGGLGSVFDATVSRVHPDRGLVELAFEGGTMFASDCDVVPGASVRIRIPAREVILASSAPVGLSLHNVLSGTVSALHSETASDHVTVQVAVGGVRLLAEVTRDAVQRLGIAMGIHIHALVKSVSIDVRGARSGQPPQNPTWRSPSPGRPSTRSSSTDPLERF